MNILLIGNGAREHCIAETFKKSAHNPKIFSYMKSNNPGIASLSHAIKIGSYADIPSILHFAHEHKVDFAFIGPEEPLSNGVSDALWKENIPSIGPKKILAQLETSKSFTRNLVEKYRIAGNPRYRSFTKEDIGEAQEFAKKLGKIVVKADGLAGGKGVQVQGDHFDTIKEGIAYATQCLAHHAHVVIEEKLEGEEFSLQCLTDGISLLATPAVQDHKRAYDGDIGPNTGGMGTYSCENHLLPFLTKRDIDDAMAITQHVLGSLKKETGEYFIGVMYGGFMKTKNGVRLIEYNARFGDPETMNVLTTLETDFVEICLALIKQNLGKITPKFSHMATVCKYIVPEGYPDKPLKGEMIQITPGYKARLYYASVDQKEDGLYMSSSRAIAVVGIAQTIEEAQRIAEEGCAHIKGKVFHRKDIATAPLLKKRVDHMNEILNS